MSGRDRFDIYKGMAQRISLIRYRTEAKWGLIRENHKLSKYIGDPKALANQLNKADPMRSDEIIILPKHLASADYIQDVFNALVLVYEEAGWRVE